MCTAAAACLHREVAATAVAVAGGKRGEGEEKCCTVAHKKKNKENIVFLTPSTIYSDSEHGFIRTILEVRKNI